MSRSHRISAGDTLQRIARVYGVSVKDILKVNPGLKEYGSLEIGYELTIPGDWGLGASMRVAHNHLWNAVYPSGLDPIIEKAPGPGPSAGPSPREVAAAQPKPPPPAAPPPQATTDTSNMAQDQQADALAAASADGKPFCET